MDIIKKMLQELDNKAVSSIYLREIALLMEEIELLKGKLRDREKSIKNLIKEVKEK